MGNTSASLALHEMMDLHEVLAFKNVCMTKSSTMQVLVSDARLLELMQSAATVDRRHIQELHDLLSDATTAQTTEQGVRR